jgi:hypothetical protein
VNGKKHNFPGKTAFLQQPSEFDPTDVAHRYIENQYVGAQPARLRQDARAVRYRADDVVFSIEKHFGNAIDKCGIVVGQQYARIRWTPSAARQFDCGLFWSLHDRTPRNRINAQ